jgi:copper chaperone CopZ
VSGVPPLARVILGVRGMDTDEARRAVTTAVSSVPGVASVDPAGAQQLLVLYDGGEATVMDLIRAARRAGFAAGML